ncbi:hypothetical protein NJ76_23905 [Rhodococcus sp. IITR03]|nr:hypothetical protein NJ76_23905 [Rhodococcus sp. IITR03]
MRTAAAESLLGLGASTQERVESIVEGDVLLQKLDEECPSILRLSIAMIGASRLYSAHASFGQPAGCCVVVLTALAFFVNPYSRSISVSGWIGVKLPLSGPAGCR